MEVQRVISSPLGSVISGSGAFMATLPQDGLLALLRLPNTSDSKYILPYQWDSVGIGARAYDALPTVTAAGHAAGCGLTFSEAVAWTDGATLTVVFKPTKADDGITGDEQVFGPVYLRNGYIVAKDGTNEAVVAAEWGIGDTVTAVVDVSLDGMRVNLGNRVPFDGTMLTLEFPDTAPATLLEVKVESDPLAGLTIDELLLDGDSLFVDTEPLFLGA